MAISPRKRINVSAWLDWQDSKVNEGKPSRRDGHGAGGYGRDKGGIELTSNM